MNDISIPEENIVFFREFRSIENFDNYNNVGLQLFASKEYETLRLSTRIVHLPLFTPFEGDEDASRIAEINNILFVTAAGNTHLVGDNNRDLWNVRHSYWQRYDMQPLQ